jgi:uncharacterized membrane protein
MRGHPRWRGGGHSLRAGEQRLALGRMRRSAVLHVPPAARWFPVVSAVRAVADQIFQMSPPPGFGHDYATEYVKGWALVAPPRGWARADTDRLENFLDHGDTGESEP